ncbi:TPA: hypothetical protein ACGOYB_001330 [Streptococcus suis]
MDVRIVFENENELQDLIVATVRETVNLALKNGGFDKAFRFESLDDKKLALKFGMPKRRVTEMRKQMSRLPRWSKYVDGTSTEVDAFKDFRRWSKTEEGRKEIEKLQKMKVIA